MKANSWLWITFGIVILILIGAIIISYPQWFMSTVTATHTKSECPNDSRLCADGTYVRRIAPQCDFAACPSVAGTSTDSTSFDVKG